MTITAPDTGRASLPEAFIAPDMQGPDVDHLFTGAPRYVVQTPPVRNDYKKASGSSDGAKTYDTTAV
ncbi:MULTISPECIES: hypothetical protein [Thermomonospora]|uniref:Uncharacterized protein n=1 Tax=Thermomonospora cellulosilytica TaxID=1411118 RepID=A0A7W3MUP8_9ACTN|nr:MULTISPECIES: hypothetical protein [Thermomonospora]MBA9002246.1 hypothetical protein [Thermomonospora cellulosilytica]